MTTCPKVRFTKDEAAAALVDAKIAFNLHGNRKRREQRAYACAMCPHWHLSSKDAR